MFCSNLCSFKLMLITSTQSLVRSNLVRKQFSAIKQYSPDLFRTVYAKKGNKACQKRNYIRKKPNQEYSSSISDIGLLNIISDRELAIEWGSLRPLNFSRGQTRKDV